MYRVKYIIIENNNIVGIEVENEDTQAVEIIEKEKFSTFRDKLVNAKIDEENNVSGMYHVIPKINRDTLTSNIIVSSSSKKKISNYTLMYENSVVLHYNRSTDQIKIVDKEKLPFRFRNTEKLNGGMFLEWLIDRVNNISRTYMNMVYIARKVGRDRDKIISDSSALSITDNFWIKTNDVNYDWKKLVQLRDNNRRLSEVALTGLLVEGAEEGLTSLFTTKGHFPKAVIGEYIYKLLSDAEMEYPAFLIGKQLGIKVAECEIEGEHLKIKLFTDNRKSLVHASELKEYYDSDLLYNAMLNNERYDIVEDLQKMYIFNYIIGNPDLHEDNYGCIYDSKTFEILELAPCYDHNLAFMENFNGVTREVVNSDEIIEIDNLAMQFVKNTAHFDLLERLKEIDLSEISTFLNEVQLEELEIRISNVLKWSK